MVQNAIAAGAKRALKKAHKKYPTSDTLFASMTKLDEMDKNCLIM